MHDDLHRVSDLAYQIRRDAKKVNALRARFRRAVKRAYRSGCSQQQIADAAEISRQRISKIIGQDGDP